MTRKRLIGLGIGFLVFLGLFYIFTHGIIYIKAGSEKPESIYLTKEGMDPQEITFEGQTKLLILSKGTYTVSAKSGEKESAYYRNVGGFSLKNVDVDFRPTKETTLIGSSDKSCSLSEPGNNSTLFYPCNLDISSAIESTSDGISTQTVYDPFEIIDSNNATFIDQFNDGLLFFNSNQSELKIEKIVKGQNTSVTTIGNFQDNVSQNNVFVKSGRANTKVAVLDSSAGQLYLFDVASPNNIKKVNVEKFLIFDENHTHKVLLSDNEIFIVSQLHPETGFGDEETAKDANFDQILTVISNNDFDNPKKYNFPDDIGIEAIEVSNTGRLLFTNSKESNGTFYTISAEGKLEKLISTEKTLNFCWVDSDTFYHGNESANSIYEYDTSQSASYLVYKYEDANVANLNCRNGQVAFTFVNNIDPEESLQHLVLGSKEQKGTRIETLFPLYIELDNGLASASLYRKIVTAKLLYSDTGLPLNQPEINGLLSKVRAEIENGGASTDNLQVIYR